MTGYGEPRGRRPPAGTRSGSPTSASSASSSSRASRASSPRSSPGSPAAPRSRPAGRRSTTRSGGVRSRAEPGAGVTPPEATAGAARRARVGRVGRRPLRLGDRADDGAGLQRRRRAARPRGVRPGDGARPAPGELRAEGRSRRSRSRARPGWSCASAATDFLHLFGAGLRRLRVDGVRRRRRAPRRARGRHRGPGGVAGRREVRPMRDLFRKRRMWRRTPRAPRPLRRGHRRRRLARARDRLLPGPRPRDHRRLRARAELHRLRSRGAQHDDPALQLQDARGRPLLRRLGQALRGPRGRARLQPAVLAAGAPDARPHRPGDVRDDRARRGQPPLPGSTRG